MSDLLNHADGCTCTRNPCSSIRYILEPVVKDLGGFSVRRLLPHTDVRAVGPFVFFDHLGPAWFKPGKGIDVRPHPHIGLATSRWPRTYPSVDSRIGQRSPAAAA